VTATTVNGSVSYDGAIQDGGQYTMTTHNGDVAVSIAEGVNATVDVSTYNGEFETAFPVQLSHTSRNRFTFVLGSGSARLTLESFQGTIRLHRPGQSTGRSRDRFKAKDRARHRERE
jgi:DUF4097 and DUF4098 domain-containing protein YvlB